MMMLIVTFRNFENAPKKFKKRKLKLKYNYSINKNFSSKTTPSTFLTQVSLRQISPIPFIEEDKAKGENKKIPVLAFILVPKNCTTTKINKKDCGHERVNQTLC
jgi:hypothetical protein